MGSIQKASCQCGRPIAVNLVNAHGVDCCLMHAVNRPADQEDSFWNEIRSLVTLGTGTIDLGGFVFKSRAIHPNPFADVSRPISFSNAIFDRDAGFPWGTFRDSVFCQNAVFKTQVTFSYVNFGVPDTETRADFYGAVFSDGVAFAPQANVWYSRFDFRSAQFEGDVRFYNVEFRRPFDAQGATFKGVFETAMSTGFWKGADFREATFEGPFVSLVGMHLREGTIDFSNATFSTVVRGLFGLGGTPMQFRGATFEQPVVLGLGGEIKQEISFTDVSFGGKVRCEGTVFRERADFARTRFRDDVQFTGCTFIRGVSCSQCVFAGTADFSGSSIGARDGNDAIADFSSAQFLAPERALFVQVNRSGEAPPLKVRLRNANIQKAAFDDVKWLEENGYLLLQDELDLNRSDASQQGVTHELVATAYRRLCQSFESARSHRRLEECTFKVMDMVRSDPSAPVSVRLGLASYRVMSSYGGSYVRAAAMLGLLLVVFSGAYMIAGLKATESSQAPGVASGVPPIVTTLHIGDAVMPATIHTLEVAAFRRAPAFVPARRSGQLIEIGETIVIPAQVALLLLALRRQFKS